MKKWWIFAFYLLLLIGGVTEREKIILWLNESNTGIVYILIMSLLSALVATVPIIPFTLFATIIGVKYGFILGLLINWVGMFIAATIYYLIARYFLAGYFYKQIRKYKKLDKLHSFIDNHLFLSIVILRLIPVIPPFIIHIYSGLKPIPYSTYVLATAIGIIPPMFMQAYGGTQLLTNLPHFFLVLTLYALTVLIIYLLYRVRTKNRVQLIKE